MSERTRTLGAALALCAALVVTMMVTEAEALTCDVTKIRVTTRTLSWDGAECDDDGSTIKFYFGDRSSWFFSTGYYLNNSGVEDFKQGAIDEFVTTLTSPYPDFPDDFQRLKLENRESGDTWGLAGFKVEIWCSGASEWYPIYMNRGVNTNLAYLGTYSTTVYNAGLDSYNGDHEVFWLMNIGDHGTDSVPEDLANCNVTGSGTLCQARVVLEDSSDNTLLAKSLTNSIWDVGNDLYVNPLVHMSSEVEDNFWRWFWTSGSFLHSAVDEAKLVLDQCNTGSPPGTGTCTMQLSYLHSWVMQAWGKQSYDPYPYFRGHIYEGDFTTADDPPGGWLTVTGYSDTDYAVTTNERYYGASGHNHRVEPTQDSEHITEQMGPACGYKSAEMILSTRGFPFEEIHDPSNPTFDEPAYDDAETWEDATAVAHLAWGYKTMCCGDWDCCDDATYCMSVGMPGGDEICDSSNYTLWWTSDRCVWAPSSGAYCWGKATTTTAARENYFWRDSSDTGEDVSESERFPYLIDYDGRIHWECQTGVDDDGDSYFDAYDSQDEFWAVTSVGVNVCIRGSQRVILAKFLEDQVDGSEVDCWDNGSDAGACDIDPVADEEWFGDTTTVVEALALGYGMFFGWDHQVGQCATDGASHYSVIDGYEYIYHPGTDSNDYLFFIADPNAPLLPAGTDMDYEGMDNLGFTAEDFQDTMTRVCIWDYDFYL